MHKLLLAAAVSAGLFVVPPTHSGAAEVLRYQGSIFDEDVDPMHGLPGMVALIGRATSPDGRHLYVVSQLDSILSIFERDLSTGALTLHQQIYNSPAIDDALWRPHWIEISSDGKFLYVSPGGFALSGVSVFARDLVTGHLTFVEVERHATLQGEITLGLSPDEDHLYATARGTDAVGAFSRDSITGELTFLQSYVDQGAGGNGLEQPLDVVVSPDGKHVYVAAFGDSAVTIFDRDDTTGLLTLNDTLVDGTPGYDYFDGAIALHASADGQHLFVSAFGDKLTAYARDATSGALTFQSGPVSGGTGGPQHLAVDEAGGRLYSAVWVAALDTFGWNKLTGELTFLERKLDGAGGVDGLDGMQGIIVSPDGQDVYTGSFNDQALSHFRLGCGNGLPDAGEVCDDENSLDSDCCSPLCQIPSAAGCLAASKASIRVKDSVDPARDQIKWKWSKGDAFDQSTLGDPVVGDTHYSLCIYDETAATPSLAAYLTVAPSAAWRNVAPHGLKYIDKSGADDGIRKLQLKTGVVGKTSVRLVAKGVNVALPNAVGGGKYFEADPRVTVRLVNGEGTCWVSEFAAAKKNEAAQFKATVP